MTLKVSSHYQMNLLSWLMQKSSVTVIRALFSLELEETFLTCCDVRPQQTSFPVMKWWQLVPSQARSRARDCASYTNTALGRQCREMKKQYPPLGLRVGSLLC